MIKAIPRYCDNPKIEGSHSVSGVAEFLTAHRNEHMMIISIKQVDAKSHSQFPWLNCLLQACIGENIEQLLGTARNSTLSG